MSATFVVTMEATYLHEVFGPFPDLHAAVAFADAEATHPQEDGHHGYHVRPLTIDGLGESVYIARRTPRVRMKWSEPKDAVERRAARPTTEDSEDGT